MASVQIVVAFLLLIEAATSLDPLNALTGVKMIFPKKVITDIPSKLAEKVKIFDENDDRLTTSYSFPKEYKTTLYKDQHKKTTLVNVYPTVETKTFSTKFFNPGYQVLETSTTQVYEALNATVEYQTTPMLNSSFTYPVTAFVQSIGYATPEYQHEILVYPTRINITELTSTKLVNFTRVDYVDNNLPFL